MYNTLVNHC